MKEKLIAAILTMPRFEEENRPMLERMSVETLNNILDIETKYVEEQVNDLIALA
ncbi:hypothetical protein ACVQ8P_08105 [Dellaglioa sp. BT-FLS60]